VGDLGDHAALAFAVRRNDWGHGEALAAHGRHAKLILFFRLSRKMPTASSLGYLDTRGAVPPPRPSRVAELEIPAGDARRCETRPTERLVCGAGILALVAFALGAIAYVVLDS
jgi:hypothetical protein